MACACDMIEMLTWTRCTMNMNLNMVSMLPVIWIRIEMRHTWKDYYLPSSIPFPSSTSNVTTRKSTKRTLSNWSRQLKTRRKGIEIWIDGYLNIFVRSVRCAPGAFSNISRCVPFHLQRTTCTLLNFAVDRSGRDAKRAWWQCHRCGSDEEISAVIASIEIGTTCVALTRCLKCVR